VVMEWLLAVPAPMNPSLSSWLLLNGTTQFGGAPKSLQGVMNSANLAATLEKDDGPAW